MLLGVAATVMAIQVALLALVSSMQVRQRRELRR